MEILKLLGTILWAILCIWLILAPFLLAYIALTENDSPRVPHFSGNKISRMTGWIFFLSVSASIVFITSQGVQALLSFLPDHWGHFEDGEFVTIGQSVSYTVAMGAWFGYFYLLENVRKPAAEKSVHMPFPMDYLRGYKSKSESSQDHK